MNDYNDDYFQLLQLHKFKSLKPPLGDSSPIHWTWSLTLCLNVWTNLPIDSVERFFPFLWPYFSACRSSESRKNKKLLLFCWNLIRFKHTSERGKKIVGNVFQLAANMLSITRSGSSRTIFFTLRNFFGIALIGFVFLSRNFSRLQWKWQQ